MIQNICSRKFTETYEDEDMSSFFFQTWQDIYKDSWVVSLLTPASQIEPTDIFSNWFHNHVMTKKILPSFRLCPPVQEHLTSRLKGKQFITLIWTDQNLLFDMSDDTWNTSMIVISESPFHSLNLFVLIWKLLTQTSGIDIEMLQVWQVRLPSGLLKPGRSFIAGVLYVETFLWEKLFFAVNTFTVLDALWWIFPLLCDINIMQYKSIYLS